MIIMPMVEIYLGSGMLILKNDFLEIQQVLIGGIRNYDMAIRLKVAGLIQRPLKLAKTSIVYWVI